MLLFACTVPARAGNGAWVTSGYEDFVQGSFDAGGDNLYVSRRGRLQMIRVWDLNGDGHVDLFFGHSHDHRGHMPVLIYPQRNGRPDAAAPLSLPTLHGTSLRPADLNCDGHLDLIVLNTPPNGAPTQPSFIYWGGPEGLSPKYRTHIPTFSARRAFVADLDGDGLQDVVVHNGGRHRFDLAGNCFSIYRQTAPGVFPLDVREDIVIASVNGADAVQIDGRLHIVFVGRLSDEAPADSVYLLGPGAGPGAGGLKPPRRLNLGVAAPLSATWLILDGTAHLAVLTAKAVQLHAWSTQNATPQAVAQIDLSGVYRVKAGDLNGDQRDDLVCARPGGITCFVAVKNAFRTDDVLSLDVEGVADIALGDVTGDGLPDLAAAIYRQARSFTTTSRLYLNTGAGFENERFESYTTHGPTEVDIADMDGDTKTDLIFACALSGTASNDPPVRIYFGSADGQFKVGQHLDLPAVSAYGGFMADYDDDGFVDLFVSNEHDMSDRDIRGEPASFLYWGGPEGLVAGRVSNVPAKGVKIPLTADLDRDGHLDLVLGTGQGASMVYYGGEDGFSQERHKKIEPAPAVALQLADVNKDGWLDLFTVPPEAGKLYLLWGAPGGFDAERMTVLPTSASHMEVADLDGNGFLDLIIAAGGSPRSGFASAHTTSAIWWGSQEGFDAARRSDLELSGASREIAVADFNKDGHLDLVFSNYRQGTHRVFDAFILWGNDRHDYALEHATRLRQAASLGVAVADLNHDGWVDIVFCNHSTGPSHLTNSRVHWNRRGRFSDDAVTVLPTRGPHNTIIPDLGNAYTRRLEEAYTSAAFERPPKTNFKRLGWEAHTPFETSIVFQLRTAPTREALENAIWIGPGGTESFFVVSGTDLAPLPPENRWIQYRAVLRTPNGAATPVLTKVVVTY